MLLWMEWVYGKLCFRYLYDVEKDSVDKGCASRCVQKFLEQFSQMG